MDHGQGHEEKYVVGNHGVEGYGPLVLLRRLDYLHLPQAHGEVRVIPGIRDRSREHFGVRGLKVSVHPYTATPSHIIGNGGAL